MADSITVGYLRAILTLDAAEFESGVRSVSPSLQSLSKDLQSIGNQAVDIGKDFTAAFTVPIVAAFAGAAKAAIDFESAFAGVRKTVSASEAEFDVMAQQFRDLAKEIPISVDELARLGEAAGALGIPKQEVVEFARVMAELGVTTNLTADQAAEAIAKIQNIFRSSGVDTENFASALVALGNAGASTESQILEMATRIAGAGDAFHLTQAEVLGFASALASLGLEAEGGGSAISRTFRDMARAISEGGAELTNFAAITKQSTTDFANAFKTDAAGAMVDFIAGLGRIKAEGGDLIATLDALGITEARQVDTLLRVAGASKMVSEQIDLATDAWAKNSALTEEARKRFETTEAQLTILWNRIKDVAITFGNALLPVIKDVIDIFESWLPLIDSVAKAFTALPVPVQELAIGMAAVVAAIGPALIIFGQMSLGAASLAKAFTETGIATRALALLMPALGVEAGAAATGFAALLGPIGLVAAALAAIAIPVALYQLPKLLDDVAQSYEPVKRTLVEGSEAAKIAAANTQEFTVNLDANHKQVVNNDAAFGAMFDSLGKVGGATQKQAETTHVLTEAQIKYNQAVKDLYDSQIIDAVAAGLKEGAEWLERNTSAAEKAANEFAKLHPTLESVVEDFSRVDMSRLADQAIALQVPLDAINDELERMHEATTSKIDFGGMFGELHTESEQAVIDFDNLMQAEQRAKEKAHEAAEGFRTIGQAFMDLGQMFTDSDMKGVFAGAGLFFNNLATFTESGVPEGFAGKAGAIAQGALAVWESTESASKGVNALNGAMAGAGAGMAFGPYGAAVGAAAGALVGLMKASENAKEEIRAGNEILEEWTDQMAQMFDATAEAGLKAQAGTSDHLKMVGMIQTVYLEMGHSAEEIQDVLLRVWAAQAQGPEAVKLVLDEINDEFERHAEVLAHWEAGVATFIDGFTMRVDGFTQGLKDIHDLQEDVTAATGKSEQAYKDASVAVLELKASGTASAEAIAKAERDAHMAFLAFQNEQMSGADAMAKALVPVQDEFNKVSEYAVDAFGIVMQQSGSAIEALDAIRPILDQLKQAQKDFGLEGSATYERLMQIDGVVTANKDIFTSVEGIKTMMMGLKEATLLTKEDVIAFGKDASDQFIKLKERGVDAKDALALMQPTLQMLWEEQQRLGVEVDTATQELLDQAEDMGLVGAAHKSVNDQIIEALLKIEDAIKRLPEAFANATSAAGDLLSTLKQIGTEQGQIQIGVGGGPWSDDPRTAASDVTAVQKDLMDRWEAMYGTRDIPVDVKRQQNEAFIRQGVAPPWPELMHQGGVVTAHGGAVIGDVLGANERMVRMLVGEGVLNPWATRMLGGKAGIDALNTDPWGAVSRMAPATMPSGGRMPYETGSGSASSGDLNINVTVTGATFGTSQQLEDAVVSGVTKGLERGGQNLSQFRRVMQHVLVSQ